MLPTLNIRSTERSNRLHDFLRNRAEGAFEAYSAAEEVDGHTQTTEAAWAVYRRYDAAMSALWDAEAAFWTAEEARLSK